LRNKRSFSVLPLNYFFFKKDEKTLIFLIIYISGATWW